jgi:hypothetical protein
VKTGRMLLQVHDELVFDVHNDELEKLMIKHEMEQTSNWMFLWKLGLGKIGWKRIKMIFPHQKMANQSKND